MPGMVLHVCNSRTGAAKTEGSRDPERESLSQMSKGKTLTHWLGVYLALRSDLSTTHKTKLFSYALLLLLWSYARFKLFLGQGGGQRKRIYKLKKPCRRNRPFFASEFYQLQRVDGVSYFPNIPPGSLWTLGHRAQRTKFS